MNIDITQLPRSTSPRTGDLPRCLLAVALATACGVAAAQAIDTGGSGGRGGGNSDPNGLEPPMGLGGVSGQPGQAGSNYVGGFGGGGGGSAAAGGNGSPDGFGNPGALGGTPGADNGNSGTIAGMAGGSSGVDSFFGPGGGGGGGSCYVGGNAASIPGNCVGGLGGNGGSGNAGAGGGGGGAGARWTGALNATFSLNQSLTGGGGGSAGFQYGYPSIFTFAPIFPAGGFGGNGFLAQTTVNLTLANSTLAGGYGGYSGALGGDVAHAADGSAGNLGCTDGQAGAAGGSAASGIPPLAGNGGNGLGLAAGSTLSQNSGTTTSGGIGGGSLTGIGGVFGGHGGHGGDGFDDPVNASQANACNGGNGGSGGNGETFGSAGSGGAGAVLGSGVTATNRGRFVGGNGGIGVDGSRGGDGGNGGGGGTAGLLQPGPLGTERGLGGDGGDGGNGGAGGGGGKGGNGGAGALLDVDTMLTNASPGRVDGGIGGRGGEGAAGGAGGSAGAGGDGGQPGTGLGDGTNGTAGSGGSLGGAGASGNGGPGIRAYRGSQVINDYFITGGTGGDPVDGGTNAVIGDGGSGGTGIIALGATITNQTLVIAGGAGTRAGSSSTGGRSWGGRGGDGGIGIDAAATQGIPTTLVNHALVNGGHGGDGNSGAGGGEHHAGNGGVGIRAIASNLSHHGNGVAFTGSITGGDGGIGGDDDTNFATQYVAGDGGGGGDAIQLSAASTLQDLGITSVRGGIGGNGGNNRTTGSIAIDWGGGDGGDGGSALVLDQGSSLTAQAGSSYQGGAGGTAGACVTSAPGLPRYHPADGGDGGAGIEATVSTIEIAAGTVVGGNGGSATTCGTPGAGGSAIVGHGGVSVILGGSATGGFKGGSSAEADRVPAIALDNSGNTLELRAGYAVTGNAVSTSGNVAGGDGLVLGGSADASLDLARLGDAAQFRGFQSLRKIGASTWTLSGTSAFVQPTTVAEGALTVNGSLASSAVTVSGGILHGNGTVGALENANRVEPRNGAVATLHAASYVQQAGGVLSLSVDNASSFDSLAVSGSAQLGGDLSLFFGSYHPSVGQQFTLLTAGSLSGQFASVVVLGAPNNGIATSIDYGATTANAVTVTITGVYNANLSLWVNPGSSAFQQAASGPSTPVSVDPALRVEGLSTPDAATVTVSGNLHAAQDRLAFVNSDTIVFGNIAGTYASGTGVLMLTSAGAAATRAQWQAALRAVTYTNIAQMPVAADTAIRTIGFVLKNGSVSSNPPQTRTVTVAAAQGTSPGPLASGRLTVNTIADNTTVDGLCSLREAFLVVNDAYTYADCPVAAFDDATIAFNLPADSSIVLAGGLPVLRSGVDVVIDGSAVVGLGIDGNLVGGIFNVAAGATVAAHDLVVKRGLNTSGGGALTNAGGFTATNMSFLDNRCLPGGGAIVNSGSLSLTNVVMTGNKADATIGGGGAIRNINGTLTIVDSTLSANTGKRYGGAILIEGGSAFITRTTIDGNQLAFNPNAGAGIYVGANASLMLDASTVSNNLAGATGTGSGGGIANLGVLDVVNSTFSGDLATGSGGAISNEFAQAVARIVGSTFVNNGAPSGGQLANTAGTLTLKNSIVSTAAAEAANCSGTLTDGGGNLRWPAADASCVGNHADPQLGVLADNGGATRTHAPAASSPAIDAVADCTDLDLVAVTNDQRGAVRPQGVACDIGAVERIERIFADGFDGTLPLP